LREKCKLKNNSLGMESTKRYGLIRSQIRKIENNKVIWDEFIPESDLEINLDQIILEPTVETITTSSELQMDSVSSEKQTESTSQQQFNKQLKKRQTESNPNSEQQISTSEQQFDEEISLVINSGNISNYDSQEIKTTSNNNNEINMETFSLNRKKLL